MNLHIDEYDMEFFHALSEALAKAGIHMRTRFGFPVLGQYSGPEGAGTYLRREVFRNWDTSEINTLNSIFPFIYNGQAVEFINLTDVESDDDRDYAPSFTCIPIELRLAEEIHARRDREMTEWVASLY